MNNTVATTLGNNYNGVDYSEYSNFKTHIYQVNGIFQIYNLNKDTEIKTNLYLILVYLIVMILIKNNLK